MSEAKNELGAARSAYLRTAAHQPIAWMEWGEAAFARAKAEGKPVLLDIGAVWCHWCHVMDRESYENAETAALINEEFVAVKVDRDERPDVDARYQAAVAAISGQGGWPLTAFLTPEGQPYFGGTYFPPEERYGRPSFRRVLKTMALAYEDKRGEVEETAASVMAAIEHNESFSGRGGEAPGVALLMKLIEAPLKQFDERNGGFGTQPKFPHAGAIDLLLDTASRGGGTSEVARQAAHVAQVTLKKMAAGGIYDQLAGGFHRYSVDERWVVPHFEKMAYDNSELLKNYVHAWQAFGDEGFARTAKDIVRWMDEWLSDRERGGFYASQDADDSLDDDGDYFTWTAAEAKAVLDAEEYRTAERYYNLRPVGDMHHDPARCVLHVPEGVSVDTAVLERAKAKLYATRLQRRTPFVDKTMYTGWNAMCVSAYLAAGRGLEMAEVTAFALKSLDRALAAVWDGERVGHVIVYGTGETAHVAGVLEDYAHLGVAALNAWEVTGEARYFEAAQGIAEQMRTRFEDAEGGGFFDTEKDEKAIGALKTRRKPLQDSPTPAGNAVAAGLLLRLSALTGDASMERAAISTLEAFGGVVEHFGLYAASYALALVRAILPPEQVVVVGDDAEAAAMVTAALRPYAASRSVIRVRREYLMTLPQALKETVPGLPGSGSVAVVCRGTTCLPPVTTAEALVAVMRGDC